MKTPLSNRAPWLLALALLISFNVAAQNAKMDPKPVIFAVTYNGSTIEPIAYIENRNLTSVEGGDGPEQSPVSILDVYFKPRTTYSLIFGGAPVGEVQVKRTHPPGECSGNSTDVSVKANGATLKGFVMALATNSGSKLPSAGYRRRPTQAERSEIEGLVRAEFVKQKAPVNSIGHLRSHNLTAVDVDRDGIAEFIGSYWIAPNKAECRLLFFIAEKVKTGKYYLPLKEHEVYKATDIMSGDSADLDEGVYHELLLDVFDYDGDGVSEIFTTTQAFEGRNFHVYRRDGVQWVKSFETYNYRCGY